MEATIENVLILLDELKKSNSDIIHRLNNLSPVRTKDGVKTNLNGLKDYLEEKTGKRPASQTIYGLVNFKKIPFIKHAGSKELVFDLDHIDKWINNGRSMNDLEL